MPHFCRLTCGPIGRSLHKVWSTWSTNDYDIHNHWIYIQRPTCTFNLSSSSSSVARTAWSGLRRLAALLSTIRCEALPHRRPGYPSTPRHLLLFSTDYSPTPVSGHLASPLRARPRADPSGLGHAATFTHRLRDPPVSKRDRKSTRLNSSHSGQSRMPSSA